MSLETGPLRLRPEIVFRGNNGTGVVNDMYDDPVGVGKVGRAYRYLALLKRIGGFIAKRSSRKRKQAFLENFAVLLICDVPV